MSVLVLSDAVGTARRGSTGLHQRSAGALLEESLKGNTVPLRGDDVG